MTPNGQSDPSLDKAAIRDILAGLFAMPQEPLEAAKVDGCTPFQSFRHITLPFLMPFIFIAMTIRSLDVARAYDIVQIMVTQRAADRRGDPNCCGR